MKKLKLEVEALHVETFSPEAAAHASVGTVRGQEVTTPESCGCPVTDLAHTCTCPNTSNGPPCFCTEWQTCWDCADS
jgi:hypothetical protein